jgi:uncharacterized protein YndB with AHSA1/START domain
MIRWVFWTAGGLAVLVAVIVFAGYMLPVGHVATHTRVIAAPPDRIAAVLSDVTRFPEWRKDVDRVEVVSSAPLTWREHSGSDRITFEITDNGLPDRLVTRIADRDLPFGGTWTWALAPEGNGTRVTITEHGEVYNPIFRVMSRFVFGHTATMDQYLADLNAYVAR